MSRDLYLHETVISDIRRLLGIKFRRITLSETPRQFCNRMAKVEHYIKEEMGDEFSLQRLAKELHQRSEDLIKLKGERLPK